MSDGKNDYGGLIGIETVMEKLVAEKVIAGCNDTLNNMPPEDLTRNGKTIRANAEVYITFDKTQASIFVVLCS